MVPTLEEWQDAADFTGRKLYEGAGIGPSDLTFQNMYDGFTLFHQFHLEGLRFAGVQRGEALDFYQTDISIEGPNPRVAQRRQRRGRTHSLLAAHRQRAAAAGQGGRQADTEAGRDRHIRRVHAGLQLLGRLERHTGLGKGAVCASIGVRPRSS